MAPGSQIAWPNSIDPVGDLARVIPQPYRRRRTGPSRRILSVEAFGVARRN